MAVADGRASSSYEHGSRVPGLQRADARRAPGHFGIGHTRYSTTGASTWRNAQPVFESAGGPGFALGHNGNLINTETLAAGRGHAAGDGRQRQRPHGRAAGPRDRRAGDGLAGARRGPAGSQGAFSLVLIDEAPLYACGTPTASGRCASVGWTAAGWSRRSPRRSTSSAPPRAGARAGRDGGHRRPVLRSLPPSRRSASTRRCACSSSCTSPGPTRAVRPQRRTRPACGWARRLARAVAGRRPTW